MATPSDGGACVFRLRERRVRQVLTDCMVIALVPTLRIVAPAAAPTHCANRRHVTLSLVLCAEEYLGAKRSAARTWKARLGVAFGSSG
jgi:hypothetical protein